MTANQTSPFAGRGAVRVFVSAALAATLLSATGAAQAQRTDPIRICDDSGCSDRERSSATFKVQEDDPAAARRLAELERLGAKDPRAAFDLGLRFFRGDGVKRDSYQALQWMREAADHGHVPAQTALGRLYLSGYEEMGSDPIEAEKWLTLAAGSGDNEAAKLLTEASAAKKSDAEYRRWVKERRSYWYGYWVTGYPYYWAWRGAGWVPY
jgi:TPR repeat protein